MVKPRSSSIRFPSASRFDQTLQAERQTTRQRTTFLWERLAQTDIYKATFKPLKATLSDRDTSVLMKLVVDGLSDRVVGCHVVGEGAAEIAQIAAIAVRMGAKKADFDATMALHPTAAEELVTMRKRSASYARVAAE